MGESVEKVLHEEDVGDLAGVVAGGRGGKSGESGKSRELGGGIESSGVQGGVVRGDFVSSRKVREALRTMRCDSPEEETSHRR